MILDEIALISSELTSEFSSEIGESPSMLEEISSSGGTQIPSAVQPVADWIQKAWEWMNQPLPIVGFSIVAIIVFLWRFLTTTSIGKKTLKKLQEAFDKTKQDTEATLEKYRQENEQLKQELADSKDDIEDLKEALGVVCGASRNKRVKEAMKAFEKEETDGKETEEGEEATDGKPDEA